MPEPKQCIAVGVILDAATDKVLVARRPEHVPHGGLWEFPGGKLQDGESFSDALARELREELNIEVKKARPLINICHEYPDNSVQLDVWLVTAWNCTPIGMEGQEIAWVRKDALAKLDFPAADKPIITAVNLPPIYAITPDLTGYDHEFFRQLEKLLETGLQLLQFRSKGLDIINNSDVIKNIYNMCNKYHCRLLINGMHDMRVLNHVNGIHLSSSELLMLKSRPLEANYLVAASCHNSQELTHACRIGVDFAVVSPVKKTASHPQTIPLGWDGFTGLVQQATIPVYALGGMWISDVDKAQLCGGQGVALIRGLWDS